MFVDFEQSKDSLHFVTDDNRKVKVEAGTPEATAAFAEVEQFLAGEQARNAVETQKTVRQSTRVPKLSTAPVVSTSTTPNPATTGNDPKDDGSADNSTAGSADSSPVVPTAPVSTDGQTTAAPTAPVVPVPSKFINSDINTAWPLIEFAEIPLEFGGEQVTVCGQINIFLGASDQLRPANPDEIAAMMQPVEQTAPPTDPLTPPGPQVGPVDSDPAVAPSGSKHIVTQEDLDSNPELVTDGVKVGDEITLGE